jgi:hypothetical protein
VTPAADGKTVWEWVSSSGPLQHVFSGGGGGSHKNALKLTFKPFSIICAHCPRILRTEECFFLENTLNYYCYLRYLFSSSIFDIFSKNKGGWSDARLAPPPSRRCHGVDWIQLTLDRVQWQALVK